MKPLRLKEFKNKTTLAVPVAPKDRHRCQQCGGRAEIRMTEVYADPEAKPAVVIYRFYCRHHSPVRGQVRSQVRGQVRKVDNPRR